MKTLYDRARHSLLQTKILDAKVRSSLSNIGLFLNTVVLMFVVVVIIPNLSLSCVCKQAKCLESLNIPFKVLMFVVVFIPSISLSFAYRQAKCLESLNIPFKAEHTIEKTLRTMFLRRNCLLRKVSSCFPKNYKANCAIIGMAFECLNTRVKVRRLLPTSRQKQ